MKSRIYAEAMGSAIINMVGVKELKQFPIPLPPLEEQKAIVAIVETLFKEVEQLEQLTVERITLKEKFGASALNQLTTNNAKKDWAFLQEHFHSFFNEITNIKKLRESVLQLAVQGKLTADWRANNPDIENASVLLKRIQKEKGQLIKEKKINKESPLPQISIDETPYDLPVNWTWCRFENVSLKIGDVDHKMPFETTNGYPYISPKDFGHKNEINFEGAKKISEKDFLNLSRKIQPQRMDLIFPRYGTIGVNRIVETDIDFLASYSCAVIKHFKIATEAYYVFYYSISPLVRIEINRYINKTTQPNVGIKSIKQFLFPLPPIEEQKAIVQKVNALMNLCDALEQQVKQSREQSEQLMQSCLREVFEG